MLSILNISQDIIKALQVYPGNEDWLIPDKDSWGEDGFILDWNSDLPTGRGDQEGNIEMDEKEVASQQTIAAVTPVSERYNLPVVMASLEELGEHEGCLQQLQTRGKCVWMDAV